MKFAVGLFSLLVASASAFAPVSTSTTTSTQLSAKIDGRTIEGGAVVPTNNFILVRKAPTIEATEGGIFLTGKAKVQKTEGLVISTGPGKTHPDTGVLFEMPIKADENVVYGAYDGTDIDIDGVKHTLIRDDDVLVKFEGDSLTLDSCSAIQDAVLVYVETKETATEGGILLAQTSKTENKPSTGKVVKVGPGRCATNGERMEMEISEGDFIKFRDYAGNEVEIEGEDYTVVRAMDILAKF
uniref:20 kDa chaperonin, chloroplastic n=1 Tax=Pseudo-nitzschia australis TaxID=44445 RepID=A0A7S4EQK1_9STRA|mmetsp:Transcript_9603/g.20787  ORF Transcript_9603/g.20787 Transcript_9603/m.20787 type:complete len:241 (+) Transcript_9603:112-834(+)